MTAADKIEREIGIDAPVQRVWELVSQPGWWVGEDPAAVAGHRRVDGELHVVDDPTHGSFPVRVEASEPPRHAAFRWASAFPGRPPEEGTGTLVEFWLSESGDGTLLRVVESGFASLDAPEEARAQAVRDNTGGWRMQLAAIKALAERAGR